MGLTSNLRLGRFAMYCVQFIRFVFFYLRLYYSTQTQTVFQRILGGRAVYYDLFYGPESTKYGQQTRALRTRFVVICYTTLLRVACTYVDDLVIEKIVWFLEGEGKY